MESLAETTNRILRSNSASKTHRPCTNVQLGEATLKTERFSEDDDVTITEGGSVKLERDVNVPDCWDQEQWARFLKKYPWLIAENGFLGCRICREIKVLGESVLKGVNISKEWSSGSIAAAGESRALKLNSLRKKIHKHRLSDAHMKAGGLRAIAPKEKPQPTITEQRNLCFASTIKVFRTVYFCIKNNRPFSDFRDLIGLQVSNEVDMGSVLHSEYSAAQITDCIAKEMRRKLCAVLVEQAPRISIYIDVSTTVLSQAFLILYMRAALYGKEAVTFFLDLVPLDSEDAECIEASLLMCLSKHGFDNDFLTDNWIGVCSDGASEILGRNSGVLERLSEKYPRLVKWHCMCHQIHLSVSDSVGTVPELSHLSTFFKKLHAVYHKSPTNLHELSECASELEVQVLRIGRVFSFDWVATSHRAITAIWESYPVLHWHFLKASKCSYRDSKQRSSFIRLNKILTSEDYLLNLAGIADAVQEVENLSQALQRDIGLPEAYLLISDCAYAIEKCKNLSGKHLKEAIEAIDSGSFKGVTVHRGDSKGQVKMYLPQFYQHLADSLRTRLYAWTSRNGSINFMPSDEFETLISEMEVLNSQRWPSYISTPWFEGEDKLESLCRRFRLNYTSVCEGFRDYIDNAGIEVPEKLQPAMRAINTLPISSSDCERGFSMMNLVMSPVRNSLSFVRLSSLMFINLLGPPLLLWDPLPYVNKWLSAHRNADDSKSRKVDHSVHNKRRYDDIWEAL